MVVAEGADTLLCPRISFRREQPEPVENARDARIRYDVRQVADQPLGRGRCLPTMLSGAGLHHRARGVISALPMQF